MRDRSMSNNRLFHNITFASQIHWSKQDKTWSKVQSLDAFFPLTISMLLLSVKFSRMFLSRIWLYLAKPVVRVFDLFLKMLTETSSQFEHIFFSS